MKTLMISLLFLVCQATKLNSGKVKASLDKLSWKTWLWPFPLLRHGPRHHSNVHVIIIFVLYFILQVFLFFVLVFLETEHARTDPGACMARPMPLNYDLLLTFQNETRSQQVRVALKLRSLLHILSSTWAYRFALHRFS